MINDLTLHTLVHGDGRNQHTVLLNSFQVDADQGSAFLWARSIF